MENNEIESMVSTLLTKNTVFQKLFNTTIEFVNLQPQEKETAQQIFSETFPDYSIKDISEFHLKWLEYKLNLNLNPSDFEVNETCPGLIYDGRARKYLSPRVLPQSKRRKSEKFNLSEFIKQKRDNGDFFQINFQDRDELEDFLEDLNEEKTRNDQKADIALNRIVQMAAILNNSCNYRLIELHSERRIH